MLLFSPTFVDAIFGGRLSSTVSCSECAHSSIVHEPFSDLSLPIPTKKLPSIKAQPVTQPKKPKLPPRRSQRIRAKVNRSADPMTSHSITDSLTGDQISLQVQCSAPVAEKLMASSVDTISFELTNQAILGDNKVSPSQIFSATHGFDNKLLCENVTKEAVDNTEWLDYLEPDAISGDHELVGQSNGTSVGTTTLESIGQTIVGDNKVSASQNLSATQGFDNKLLCKYVTEEAVDNTAWLDYLEQNSVSGDHELAAQSNGTSVTKEINEEVALDNDVLLQNALEFYRHDPSHCLEETSLSDDPILTSEIYDLSDDTINTSEICDTLGIQDSVVKDAAPNDDFSRVSSEYGNQVIPKDPTLEMDYERNSWDEECPLQVQSSEILLLPYKEDKLTSVETLNGEDGVTLFPVGCERDSLDFGVFGGLFNEPENATGPIMRSPSNNVLESNEAAETGITVRNRSGSDLDEIDDSDSPVSVERCLAYFTKPELLSKNEHAWHCENCSKTLVQQRRSKKKLQKSTSIISLNRGESKIRDDQLSSGKDFPYPISSMNLSNGNNKKDLLDSSADRLVSSNGNIDGNQNCTFESNQTAEQPPVASQLEEEKSEINDSPRKLTCNLESSNDSCSVNKSGSTECNTNNVLQRESQFLIGEQESEGSEGEVDSESIKVKRDATKRILIDKAPPILTIHLKRFSQDSRGRISKLNGHVDFRDTFDLKPYMHPRCTERENYKYRLLGVVEHSGTMRGGHYVAYVRGGPKSSGKAEIENDDDSVWYHTSDAYVREVSFEEVLRCEAYILFYEQV